MVFVKSYCGLGRVQLLQHIFTGEITVSLRRANGANPDANPDR